MDFIKEHKAQVAAVAALGIVGFLYSRSGKGCKASSAKTAENMKAATEALEEMSVQQKKDLQHIKQKFDKFDVDGNGTIDGKELDTLAEWVFSSFNVHNSPCPASERASLKAKLLKREDVNEDGGIDFDEFTVWYAKTCKAIGRYRKSDKERKNAKAVQDRLQAESDAFKKLSKSEKRAMQSARHKFDQMDTDSNGVLEGKELTHLAEWVFASFHATGTAMTKDRKAELVKTLLRREDENEDGMMSFAEFANWYAGVCKQIGAYHKSDGFKKAEAAAQANISYVHDLKERIQAENDALKKMSPKQLKALRHARHKFDQLDIDSSGALEKNELMSLSEWMLNAFHPLNEVDAKERDSLTLKLQNSLVDRMNLSMDKTLDFGHFQTWYDEACVTIAKFEGNAEHVASKKMQAENDAMKKMSDKELKALSRARHKFEALDADGNGTLEGKEIGALADWVFLAHHPGSEPLEAKAREELVAKLMTRLDDNGDGVMDFGEFSVWFGQACKDIEAHRRKK